MIDDHVVERTTLLVCSPGDLLTGVFAHDSDRVRNRVRSVIPERW